MDLSDLESDLHCLPMEQITCLLHFAARLRSPRPPYPPRLSAQLALLTGAPLRLLLSRRSPLSGGLRRGPETAAAAEATGAAAALQSRLPPQPPLHTFLLCWSSQQQVSCKIHRVFPPATPFTLVLPLRLQHGRVRIGRVSSRTLCPAAVEGHVQAGGADGRDDSLLQ